MAERSKKHISGIERFSSNQAYKYPRKTVIEFPVKQRNRALHGKRLFERLQDIRQQFNIEKEQELPEGIVKDDAVYVEFYSAWGYDLKFDQLHDNRDRQLYQILSILKETDPDDNNKWRYRVVVMLREGGISHFLNKFRDYIKKNSIYRGQETDKPVANDLVANIEDIQRATLEAFWVDANFYPFPSEDEYVWWEVWLRRSAFLENETKVFAQLEYNGLQVGGTRLEFTEHVIILVQGTASQLSGSLMLLDCLAELRKPQEINDFITHESITYTDKQEWMEDLLSRTFLQLDGNEVLVCLLDSGVNRLHPLLEPVIPGQHLHAWKPDWGIADTEPNGGHGTGMAGLTLYGDITDALANRDQIVIYHGIESFKIIHPSARTDIELFGVCYKDGCNTVIIERPGNRRVFCLSVTNNGIIESGRPSSSSAALDDIAFGNLFDGAGPQLFFVSGGNIQLEKEEEYPITNFRESIEDPGQAYNVITVGAYTRKDRLSDGRYKTLAAYGGMSPKNTTSGMWENQWPNKPDIVLEGGNMASDGRDAFTHHELDPLSLDSDYRDKLFSPFGGTSSAAALASKMAAELRSFYPNFWPETIRALMIHSADWTPAMLHGRNINSENDRRAILRSVGYGVPNLEKALYSANNALTLICENEIQPYRINGGSISYKEYHLYDLPWPSEVLRDALYDRKVRITVTLSYFIEPNPGARQYASNFSYQSHDLNFSLIKPNEPLNVFKRRISGAADWEDEEEVDSSGEEWTIKRVRSKGSIKKDFLDTNGASLSQRNILAVYPGSGWYRTRKKLKRFNNRVRYSLIVTIETEETNIDIYTPVEAVIATIIPITT